MDLYKDGCIPLSSAWKNIDIYLQATDSLIKVSIEK